jgi:8-oxo-dGTP pyrophosphatase MutT (NUDIX family)
VIDPRAAALLTSIAAYRATDEWDAGFTERLRSLLSSHDRPFDRDGFAPGHVTASGFLLDPLRERLLLIHHRRLGIWIQPGGHVDPDDAGPEAAARREIAEETGLDHLESVPPGLLDIDVHRYPARPDGDPEHEHFDVRFAYVAPTDRILHNDEVHDALWVAPGDLAGIGADRSILRPAAKLFGQMGL